MLQIYTDVPNSNCIVSNDKEFELNTAYKILNSKDSKYRDYISKIENVRFDSLDNGYIISSITNESVPITDISTGCKTIINILVNPDKIVFAIECGKNYSDYIYAIKDGKIYLPYFLIPRNIDKFSNKEFEVHSKGKVIKINNIHELERWYNSNAE